MEAQAPDINLDQLGAREILDSLPDGAYITDPRRHILFWSRSAARITGWQREEVVGHSCSENILAHVDKDGHRLCGEEFCPLHRAIITGEATVQPLLVFAQHRLGHRVPVEVSVSPIRNGAGQVLGGIEVFRDLTSTAEDLQRAKRIQAHALECPLPSDERLRVSVRYTPEGIVGGENVVRSLSAKGAALGLFEESAYTEGADRLEPEEALLLFTDGAFEITNAQDEPLGQEGLLRLLAEERPRAGEINLETLEARLLAYGNQVRLPDDLTLLSVHRFALG